MATYTVKSRDTLYGIARKFNTTVRAIELVNPGIRPRHLRIGQVINLSGATPTPTPTPTPTGQYLFVDEFTGPAGSPPDPSKWVHDIGYGQWGNNEMETYTSDTANCFQDGNSNLVIRAIKTSSGYSSARIKTLGKFSGVGCTWEARMKLPLVAGTWPAWWMMGTSPSQWPQSGEVDVVEAFGSAPFMETSVHVPDGSGGMQSMSGQKGIRYQDNTIDAGWHTYRMVWDVPGDGAFKFYLDGAAGPYLTVTSNKTGWPYGSNPLYMLLNLAVGGAGGGSPSGTAFPVDFMIDYVRVWA